MRPSSRDTAATDPGGLGTVRSSVAVTVLDTGPAPAALLARAAIWFAPFTSVTGICHAPSAPTVTPDPASTPLSRTTTCVDGTAVPRTVSRLWFVSNPLTGTVITGAGGAARASETVRLSTVSLLNVSNARIVNT